MYRTLDQKKPNCRNNFKAEKLERTLKEDLEDTKITCFYKLKGCSETVNYEKLFNHQKQCPFKPSQCRWCKTKGLQKEIIFHASNCEARALKCFGCLKWIPYKEFDLHEYQCLKNEILSLREKLKNIKKLKFSRNTIYKHDGIQIISNNIAKMNINEYQKNSVVLLKPKLKNKLVTWKIKINKLTCWIGLGIGNGKVLTSNNFVITDSQIENMQHASFMISSNGHVWSSEVKHENFVQNFIFLDNDTVIMEFNPNNKVLTFSKNGQLKTLNLSKNFLSSISGDIYAIVVLGGVGDSVEIIDSTFS